jgi:hypothetical protein
MAYAQIQRPSTTSQSSANAVADQWQQGPYIGDSGINSGANTGAGSLTGHEGDLAGQEGTGYDMDYAAQGYTQQQVDGKTIDNGTPIH